MPGMLDNYAKVAAAGCLPCPAWTMKRPVRTLARGRLPALRARGYLTCR